MSALAEIPRRLALATGLGHRASHWPVLWPAVPACLLVHRLPGLPSGQWIAALGIAGALAFVVRNPAARWLGVALLVAAWCLWRATVALDARLPAHAEGIDLRVAGHVESMPVAGAYGAIVRFRITRCMSPAADESAPEPALFCPQGSTFMLRWSVVPSASPPEPGTRWALVVRLKRNHGVLNPGGYDPELAALAAGIAGRGYVRTTGGAAAPRQLPGREAGPGIAFERARHHVRARMRVALAGQDPHAAGTVVALVTGDQAAIPPRLWQVYQRTGVGHLMSISGLHITMLAGMALWACRRLLVRLACRWPARFERWPAPVLAWWPALGMAFAYSIFSGWGVPAQRTCWMFAVAAGAFVSGRAGRIGEVLALAAAVVVVSDPWAPLSAGFWLSFAAVAAIVLHGGASGRRPSWWREAVGTQWAATIAMLPLGAVFFASASVIGPVANAFAIPLVSALVTPLALGSAAIAVVSTDVAGLVFVPVVALVRLLVWLLQLLAGASGATAVLAAPALPALACSVAAVFLLLAPTRPVARRHAGVLLLPLLLGSDPRPPPGHWRLTAIDVGQGNAVLVETHRHRLLYDTGPSYGPGSDAGMRHVVPWLWRQGIAGLDSLVLSHEDDDHAGGAGSVLASLEVGRITGSLGSAHRLASDPRFVPCERGQRWTWDGVQFDVLHPGPEQAAGLRGARGQPQRGGNDASCVLRIRSPAGSALLAGDIEARAERELVAIHGNAGLRADVLLVPHHGSTTSSTPALLGAVQPSLGIIQVGYRNRFRHPGARVLDRYRRYGIPIRRSDADALVRVVFAPGRAPRVAEWRRADRRYWRIRLEEEPAPDAADP